MALLDHRERRRIRGFVINKFRGDPDLLAPGVAMIERRLRRPCMGVIPHLSAIGLDEEDSVALEDRRTPARTWRVPHMATARGPDRPLRVLTHCNTGRLATTAVGTALGALRVLHARGKIAEVLVDETRPLLQGARLTAWELAEAGIAHRLTIDSAAAWAMATGQVDCVMVGADRIAADGSVANKIGTYALAVAAHRHGIPFIVVAPESTRDMATATGAEIAVEELKSLRDEGASVVGRGPTISSAAADPCRASTPWCVARYQPHKSTRAR